jgi:signal transduction histidine kinase
MAPLTSTQPNTTMEPATKARIGALILTAVPVTALGVVAGVGAGIAPLACVPVALALGVAMGLLVADATGVAPEPEAVEPAAQTFGVRALLTRAAYDAGPALDEVEVLVDVTPPRLRTVGDPECLHVAVAELIEQAVRRSPPGSVVTLAARSAPAGVRLEVVDEGGGDCGEGLAVARGIVDRHGGELRAERARPHGCRVVVELPGV